MRQAVFIILRILYNNLLSPNLFNRHNLPREMATNVDILTDILTCPVCFEHFEADGDHIPRLLPCTHSLCHTCIGQLIRNNRLQCPTCRMKHETRNKEKSFPQNKYVLTMIKRRKGIQGEEMDEFRRCPEHGQNEILFCIEPGCMKTICPLCLSKVHLGHKVVAIKDETEDVLVQLLKNIEITKKGLNAKIKHVEDVSGNAAKKTEINLLQLKKEKDKIIHRLEKKKEEIMKQYDRMVEQAEDKKTEQNETLGNELAAIKDNDVLLTSIKQSIESEENTNEDILKKLDTVKGVTEIVEYLPRVKNYEYSEYIPGHENLLGTLVKKEMSVSPVGELQGQGQYNIYTVHE